LGGIFFGMTATSTAEAPTEEEVTKSLVRFLIFLHEHHRSISLKDLADLLLKAGALGNGFALRLLTTKTAAESEQQEKGPDEDEELEDEFGDDEDEEDEDDECRCWICREQTGSAQELLEHLAQRHCR
jgi:hypothetical protein